jgi:Uma2 family endonuclease
VSFEDFHDWLKKNQRAEWVDGEVIEPARDNLDHHHLVGFLLSLLTLHTDRRRSGDVFYSVFLMRLPHRPSARMPDLFFVAAEHRDRIMDTFCYGPADLVVEIVSPESTIRDRREKFLEYQEAKIPEFWLLDQPRQEAYFYVLDENGKYQRVDVGEDGVYTSTMLPGLRLPVEWLWRSPLPTLREAQTALLG